MPIFASKAAQAADDKQNDQGVASSRMSYSRFLEYLDMGRVRQVCTDSWPRDILQALKPCCSCALHVTWGHMVLVGHQAAALLCNSKGSKLTSGIVSLVANLNPAILESCLKNACVNVGVAEFCAELSLESVCNPDCQNMQLTIAYQKGHFRHTERLHCAGGLVREWNHCHRGGSEPRAWKPHPACPCAGGRLDPPCPCCTLVSACIGGD